METVIAALLAALVGAAAGGIVTARVTNWTARRQLTRESRVRLYLEVLPAFQEDVHRRWFSVNNGSPPPRLHTLVEHWMLLRRLASVASEEDRRQVDQMEPWFEEVAKLDVLLWGEDERAYGVVPDELRDVVASSQEALNDLSKKLYGYGEWLSQRLD